MTQTLTPDQVRRIDETFTEVQRLKDRQSHDDRMADKIETAIESLEKISGDVARMIAIHDERIQFQEERHNRLESIVVERRQEFKEEMALLRNVLDGYATSSQTRHDAHDKRIQSLEKWRWQAMGVVSVLIVIAQIIADKFL